MAQQQAIPIYQGANSTETFYIPAFEIRMQGRGFPDDVLYDVMQVTYKDRIDAGSGDGTAYGISPAFREP